jgi:hypothetical protein
MAVLEELVRARLRAVIDPRTTPMDFQLRHTSDAIVLTGHVFNRQIQKAVVTQVTEAFAGRPINAKGLVVLQSLAPRFVRIGWEPAPFFRGPRVDIPDTLTTALPGAVLRVYRQQDGFYFVHHPDGYVGFIEAHQASEVSKKDYLVWRNGPLALVRKKWVLRGKGLLPAGSRLALVSENECLLPDGSRARLDGVDWERRDPIAQGQLLVQAVKSLEKDYRKTPYHWGGKTQDGTDCSGYVQTVASLVGISLPRDASMQCYVGDYVGALPGREDLLPGDILYFMNERGFVYHVGIYLGGRRFSHSSRQFGGVVISSFDPQGPRFSQSYMDDLCYARRVGSL